MTKMKKKGLFLLFAVLLIAAISVTVRWQLLHSQTNEVSTDGILTAAHETNQARLYKVPTV